MEYQVVNLDRGASLAAQVSVAGDSRSRRKGLLGASLAADSGLWIASCEAVHTFGMELPIDVVFLDRQLRIRKLVFNLRPRRFAVCLAAASVLEMPVGSITRTKSQIGDRLRFQPHLAH